MGTVANDTFNRSPGSEPLHSSTSSANVSTSGHTWLKNALSSAQLVFSLNKVYQDATSGGGVQYALTGTASTATTDAEYTEGVLDFKSLTGAVGIGVRVSADADNGYFLIYIAGEWRRYRLVGGAFTQLGSGASATPSIGSHTIRITVTGTGASVSVACLVDGADPFGGAHSDTSGSRITTLGRLGLYSDTSVTTTTGIHFDSVELVDAAASGPTITGPSGAAGAGTSTANIAENATTGPTFTTDITLGGGYPSLTGAQAANWSITTLSSTSWRLDPVTPFNFEASPTNPQTVVFNASASVAQTCTITIVNMPEFSGTVPAQSGITGTSFSLDLSPYFGTGSFTYAIASGSLTGSGLSLNTSSGVISGTLGTVAVYTVTVSAAGTIGSADDTNSFTITVSSTGTAPTVSTHPANTTVTAGATASFTAAASGSPTPTVQWQENTGSWSNISGQTTTTLSLGVVGTPDNGRQFRAVFTNSSGSATTNTATLTVNAAAGDGTITSEPLKNNMGQLLGAATLSWVGFRNASTGADVLLLTSVAVNSSSIFTTGTNAALAPGQLYAINWKTSDGKYGYAWANAV